MERELRMNRDKDGGKYRKIQTNYKKEVDKFYSQTYYINIKTYEQPFIYKNEVKG